MNNMLKTSLLTLGLGLAVCSTNANAALATHSTWSNAVNYCAAFTPGPADTLRNRVIGAENVGTEPLAVSCNYASFFNGAPGNTRITGVGIYFTNNSSTNVQVTCTLLTGTSGNITGAGSAYSVPKSTTAIIPGGAGSISWGVADNPTAGSTDLGNLMVGVNCILPVNIVMSATNVTWTADNGLQTPPPPPPP